MNKSKFVIILCLFLIGNSACSQKEKKVIVDIRKEENKVFEFNKDISPSFSKIISENKSCNHEIYKDDLYLTSIEDEYVKGQYKNEFVLRKMDLEGNEQWVFVINEFKQIAFKDILPTEDGVYILYEGYTGNIERDCYLKKLDKEGKELWTKNFGKNYGTESLDIIKLDPKGHLVFPLSHYETSFLYRISSSGKILNKVSFSEKSELRFADFDFDQDGNIYAIGQISSYPEKKYMVEVFFYKLDSEFNLLQKKVQLMGRVSIANEIVFLGNGKFAVKISSDIDFNRKPIETQIVPLFFLMDADLKISNISQTSSTKSIRSTFKSITENKIIGLDISYIERNTYFIFHVFDGEMNYQKSTLINFNTGIGDITFLPNGEMLVNKYSEEIFKIKVDLN